MIPDRGDVQKSALQSEDEAMKTKRTELEKFFRHDLVWAKTDDPAFPWQALFKGNACRLRMNDFPEEPQYTLLVAGKEMGDFDDWPPCWKKDERTNDLTKSEKPKVVVVK